jgi:hypothetical protein
MNWEHHWSENKNTSFGVDTQVKTGGSNPVVIKHGGGGGFSNGVLLVLGGFAVGTIWGEGLINRMIGVKSHG